MIKQASYDMFTPTAEQEEEAKIRAEKIPADIKNSILKGEGRYTGAIGEVIFKDYIGGLESAGRGVFNFDVMLKNGKLCEVKTKKRTVPPKSFYECSVANFNATQQCDYYIFASTLVDFSKVWLLGYLTPQELKDRAVFRKKGDLDPSNNQICSADCWNVKISQLHKIKDLK